MASITTSRDSEGRLIIETENRKIVIPKEMVVKERKGDIVIMEDGRELNIPDVIGKGFFSNLNAGGNNPSVSNPWGFLLPGSLYSHNAVGLTVVIGVLGLLVGAGIVWLILGRKIKKLRKSDPAA